MRTHTLALAVLAGLSTPTLVLAQPAEQRAAFIPMFARGQALRYTLALDAQVRQNESSTPEFTMHVVQSMDLDLEVVSIDDKGAVLGGVLSSVNVGAEWGDRMFDYSWPKVNEDVPLRLPPILILEVLGKKAREVRVQVRVDMPHDGADAKVVVSGFEDVETALDNQDVFDDTVLGLLANEQIADALSGAFFVEGASDKSLRPGAGWETQDRIALGPAGAIDVETSWVFKSLDGATASVIGTPRAQVAKPVTPDPAAPGVALQAQESSIEVAWNTELHRADTRVSKQAMTTLWTLGPMTLTQEQHTTLTLKRVK